jgi:SAM-dependent MidA family methyltransferase
MERGHPGLVEAIRAEIAATGPIPFARFMELALYHPRFGYYTNPDRETERIGWSGDYYTTADVHPIFAQVLVKQVAQIDALLGHPSPFTVIEMGPGKGLFARDFLAACRAISHGIHGPNGLFKRLQYVLIERSPALQAAQQRLLAALDAPVSHISWSESLAALDPDSVTGVLFSNELVDAFPVHRLRIQADGPKEIHVADRDGGFCEVLKPLSTPALVEYLNRLEARGIVLQDGSTVEVNLEAGRWMREVARVLGRGFVITIDYGHTAPDLYSSERRKGTLLGYYRQLTSENPYERVGLQDLTAHVDFSALAAIGEEAGLELTGFTNQMSFFISLGVEEMLQGLEPGSAAFQAVAQLLRPNGMGSTFKILVQHKGLARPELAGLRYKPFWRDALLGESASVSRQRSSARLTPHA